MKHLNSSMKSEQNGNKNINYSKDTSLEHHLSEVKLENYTDSFPEVENWLYRANIQSEKQTKNLKNERTLHRMKNFFFANKLRLVYTVVALAVIIAACNMPVTQTETAGHVIALSVPAENKDFQSKLGSLQWMKNAQVSANENTNNGRQEILYTIMLPNTTEEQVKNYGKEIEALGGITMIKIKPVNYDVKRPLYSAALDNFFSIKIDATGKSDEEVQAEIQKQLDEQGIKMKFGFGKGPDGKRDIRITKDDNTPQSMELTIDENNGKEKLKVFSKKVDPGKFKNKTDKEIREMVRKDFDNPHIKDEEIKITREGDDVKVKVEVNREK